MLQRLWKCFCDLAPQHVQQSPATVQSSPVVLAQPLAASLVYYNLDKPDKVQSNVTFCAQVQCRNLEHNVKLCEGKHRLWSISCVGSRGGGSEPLPAAAKIFIRLPESMSANSYTWSRRKKWEGGGEERERGKRRRNWGDERCSLCACQLIVKHDALGGRGKNRREREGSEERGCLNSLWLKSQGMNHVKKAKVRKRERQKEEERERLRRSNHSFSSSPAITRPSKLHSRLIKSPSCNCQLL